MAAAAVAERPEAPALDSDLAFLTPKLRNEAEWPWKPAPVAAGAGAADAGAAGAAAAGAAAAASEEDSSQPEEVLSFERHLWDRFDLLWQSRAEPSLRLLEEVAEVLRSRADLERKYGESLRGFGSNIQLNPQENTVHGAVDAVLVNFRNRGEQSLQLADEIEQDIVATFSMVAKQHREVSKRIYNDMSLLRRYCENWRHQHEKLARRYGSRCSEAEGAAQECLQGLGMKTADRLKLGMRATTLSKQARVSEHEYYSSIEQTNRAQALFDQQLPVMLSALQEMEEKRSRCMKDGLMKLAVFETSWLRNLQYDLEATVKASEGADTYKDLQDFIRQHRSPTVRQDSRILHTPQLFFQLGKSKTPSTPSRSQVEACATVKQIMEDELRPVIHGLLVDNPSAGPSDEVKEQLEQLRQGLGDPRRRAAVSQALRQEVLSHQPQGATLESSKSVPLATATFDAVVALFKACLDACDEQNDSWCGRDFMVLAQLFRAEGGQLERPTQLLSRVYNHALWNKVTFWEEVLLLGLCEAHSAESVWRRTLPAGSQFSQPSMTVFLERFVGYMMAFGISFDQGRNSVMATLKKHNQLLGTSVKAYATLLLQRYEEAAPTASATPGVAAPVARTLSQDVAPQVAVGASGVGGDISCTSAGAETSSIGGLDAGPLAAELSESGLAGEAGNEAGGEEDGGEAAMDDFEAVALGVQATFPEDNQAQAAVREQVANAMDGEATDSPGTPSGTPCSAAEETADVEETPSGTPCSAAEAEKVQEDGDSPFKVMAKAQRSVSDVFG